MKKVKILGAGLSGLSASINLAKNNCDVLIFEKRKDCGCRFHGDYEGIENWSSEVDALDELKLLGIKNNFYYKPFKKMYLTDGIDKVEFVSKKPIFYLIKRGITEECLDQSLKNQAFKLGVKIKFESNVKNADIIATGPSKDKITAVDKGIIFDTEMDDIAVALVNKKTSFKGYSYLLVSKGYGRIGSVSMYQFQNMNRYFENTYRVFNKLFDLDIKNQKKSGGIGSFRLNPKLFENKSIVVGEAAGLQDFLWGFGMRYAFVSGYLAAKSIIENESYKKLIKKNLSDRLKASIVNRYYAERMDDYGRFLMKTGKRLKQYEHIKFLRDTYNFSLFYRTIYPIAKTSLKIKYKKRAD